MPLFQCTKCSCVENTACCNYWSRKIDKEPLICSECETGTWHGRFEKRDAAGMLVDNEGHLWGESQREQMPKHLQIVRTAQPIQQGDTNA